jgi:acid phosphatase type 7
VTYGDMGVDPSPAATSTALRVASELDHLDFVLHIGDISYARGYGYIWELFHNLIEPISSRLPYMVSMGNHEYDHMAGGQNDPSGAAGQGFHPVWGNYGADSGGECGVPMYHRFKSPTDGNGIFWYSFNYGNVHIVQISSEHDYTVGSEQYQWLETNLKAVDRALTPFVVVTSHRPMYNSEEYESDYEVSLHMRAELDPLWDAYDVDAVLAGHYHSYERTCSVFNDVCYDETNNQEHKGTVHITIGSAGASLDSVNWYDVPWHVYGSFEFGYLRVSTTRDDMLLEYVHNTDGSVADSVLLKARY